MLEFNPATLLEPFAKITVLKGKKGKEAGDAGNIKPQGDEW
jgi:hypothetical protein